MGEYYLQMSQPGVEKVVASLLRDDASPDKLGQMLFEAASCGYYWLVGPLAVKDEVVNYQDPQTGQTALHVAAAYKARQVVRVLLASGRCDHLIRDNKGRLASDLAYTVGNDPALARLLGIKEAAQMKKAEAAKKSRSRKRGPPIGH